MSNSMANDLRTQYDRTFATVKGILETFPDDKWLEEHGDEYYIPSRIAYHIVEFIDGMVAGGHKDPNFRDKLPFGSWHDATAATLPGRAALLSYFEEVLVRAQKELAEIDDEGLQALLPPEMARMGATRISAHFMALREIAAHTGEMNKMLIENGKDDVWVSR
ncbi:MAG: DinB family protein [Oscillospiraceae bacterium]|nr:DinB family protein [Oscillospiraceae bacterium]